MGRITDLYRGLARRGAAALYRHTWQLALILAVAIALACSFALWPRPHEALPLPSSAISAADLETAQDRSVVVYISGAVHSPGLYTLSSGLRVVDAIVAAGGVTSDADPNCLPNLSAHLQDAKQIAVPFAGRCARGAKKVKLDINSASRVQLLGVPGMDPALADGIIAYREQNGGFQSLTELKGGLGLDATTYKQLAKSLTVP